MHGVREIAPGREAPSTPEVRVVVPMALVPSKTVTVALARAVPLSVADPSGLVLRPPMTGAGGVMASHPMTSIALRSVGVNGSTTPDDAKALAASTVAPAQSPASPPATVLNVLSDVSPLSTEK